jgi:hypothetical protein
MDHMGGLYRLDREGIPIVNLWDTDYSIDAVNAPDFLALGLAFDLISNPPNATPLVSLVNTAHFGRSLFSSHGTSPKSV